MAAPPQSAAIPSQTDLHHLLSAHARGPSPQRALLLFYDHMLLHSPAFPDRFTFPLVLKACSRLRDLPLGRQIHATWLKTPHLHRIPFDLHTCNTLLHLYAVCGEFGNAHQLFDRMSQRDVISYNAMISAHVRVGNLARARKLFNEMPERDSQSWNFMISGYATVGLADEATELLNRMPMPLKGVLSWNAVITAYLYAERFHEALVVFEEMQRADMTPDSFTLVGVLSACSHLGALQQGKWVHAYIENHDIEQNSYIGTALVDMYSKCGCIHEALRVFRDLPQKDVKTWNSLISGLGMHGYGREALCLFSEMEMTGLKPNEVTFLAVLSACSHTGLINEGLCIFDAMNRVYGLEVVAKHYGCIVDLLGRAGRLGEAEELIERMPLKSEASVAWESLLGACGRYGDVETAERVAMRLGELDSANSACYVMLSNVYARSGRWAEVRDVRRRMRARNIGKEPGWSSIEANGVQVFLAGEGRGEIFHNFQGASLQHCSKNQIGPDRITKTI
ncbi:hypothetical protein AMTRI_Chr13g91920 [Amborella trichopoda]